MHSKSKKIGCRWSGIKTRVIVRKNNYYMIFKLFQCRNVNYFTIEMHFNWFYYRQHCKCRKRDCHR